MMPLAAPTTVKLLSNFAAGRELCETWKKLCKVGYAWNAIHITDRDDADYFCVVNHPRPGDFYDPDRTIVLTMEEKQSRRRYFPEDWVDIDRRRYFAVFDERNSLEWHLGQTYSQLRAAPIVKTDLLSTVTSSECRLDGHVRRLRFLEFLERKGVPFDLFGRDNTLGFRNYVTALPYHQKDAGLFPYRYTIAVEAVSADGYFTEKLVDAILAECLCFYWGCPNLESYIDARAFIRLDLDDFDHSLAIMDRAVRGDEWEKRLAIIRHEKARILDDMQIMPVIERIIGERI